jgi:hypothetical protein
MKNYVILNTSKIFSVNFLAFSVTSVSTRSTCSFICRAGAKRYAR